MKINNTLASKIALLGILLSILISCATTGKLKKALDSWLKEDVNRAMISWGPPSNTYTMPNGKKQYSWLYVGSSVVTTKYYDYLDMVQSGAVTYWCEITLTANSSSKITAYSFRGNACRIH